jgi:hypothetical protein
VTTERREYDFGSAVYGSILVAALVGAMFEESADARSMTLSLLGSIVILWIAHVWSAVIGERVAEGRMFQSAEIRSIAVREWPLVEAGLVPGVLLAIAWIGWCSRDAGAVLALVAAVVQLVAWGCSRVTGPSRAGGRRCSWGSSMACSESSSSRSRSPSIASSEARHTAEPSRIEPG